MHKFLLLSFTLILNGIVCAQTATINGTAGAYVGKTINLYTVEDFFSQTEKLIGSTTVKPDSTFSVTFQIGIVQKVILRANNNHGYLLVQPNASYNIDFPDRNAYDPYKPSGNEVEIGFYDLDSTDINYKVLGFQRWVDNFLGNNYHLKSTNAIEFAKSLDRFKANVQKAYIDDTSVYLKAHVRFTIAGLDNIPNAAERNRYEKYDFYLRKTPVYYNVEAYMAYISSFYQQLVPRLSSEANEAYYEGILHSSPTMLMKALSTEFTLSNLQLRELIMIKSLGESYYAKDFPQTNILTILDSLSERTLFKEHQLIAHNLRYKLTQLVQGGKAPPFVFMNDEGTKTLTDYRGKYLYLCFADPNSERTQQEIPLLKEIYGRYNEYVNFVLVYKKEELNEKGQTLLKNIPWDVYALPESNSVWRNYEVITFPHYTLLDVEGYVVNSPALGPTPNGQYQTIDETFYNIHKTMQSGN